MVRKIDEGEFLPPSPFLQKKYRIESPRLAWGVNRVIRDADKTDLPHPGIPSTERQPELSVSNHWRNIEQLKNHSQVLGS